MHTLFMTRLVLHPSCLHACQKKGMKNDTDMIIKIPRNEKGTKITHAKPSISAKGIPITVSDRSPEMINLMANKIVILASQSTSSMTGRRKLLVSGGGSTAELSSCIKTRQMFIKCFKLLLLLLLVINHCLYELVDAIPLDVAHPTS
jgi:hypothetical protein